MFHLAPSISRPLLAICAIVTVSELAWAQGHPRSKPARRASADGEVDSTFETLAPAVVTPSRYRSRRDSVASVRTRSAALLDTDLRIVISLNDRQLWLMLGPDTLYNAPVGVSTDSTLEYSGRTWRFETPRGVRSVLAKHENPVWIPPDWHYAEVARNHSLALAAMTRRRTMLSDGNWLEVRNDTVGVVDATSREFATLPTNEEIVFDGTLFIPPVSSVNRRIEGELGFHSLDTGDGILLHGTPHKASIGEATTHGCIRLRDEDILWLYQITPLEARVYIY